MTYRFQTVASVPLAGLLLTHGLATAPDEYWIAPLNASAVTCFITGAPDLTNIRVTGGLTGTVAVTARVAHSIIE